MSYENENYVDHELGWNDAIENDNPGWVLLPEGDYGFTVEKFERGRHSGSEKLPPCNKAIMYLKISSPEGETTIRHNLFLHTKTEGLLCAFFTAVGLRKHGEKFVMNFDKTVGAHGRAKIGIYKWTGNDGKEHESNEIEKFYDPPEEPEESAPAKKFEPGRF